MDAPARVDETGVELKRGAFLNTIAMLASNFRGIFTFLVARLLGPAALGIFSVAWSTTDIISKIGVLGLDNAITTFIARSEAVGNHARSRALFRVAVVLGVAQSVVTAAIVIVALRFFNNRLHVQPQMVSALALVLCAMPGLALYRISTAISRGMKVMQHDIYSRGMTEPIATTLAFLLALAVGFKESSPEVAAIIGTAASGLVALALASKLFRHIPTDTDAVSPLREARSLIAYAAPISIYQLINAFIARLDLLMLGYFVGRAPGVTLATVGVYSAVIGTANGLRKVNQAFNPIFAPVVARHDRDGRSRRGCRHLRSTCPVDALDPVAAGSSDVARGQHDSAHLRPGILARRRLARHRRSRQCYQCVCCIGRNSHHGATATFESSAFVDHMHCRCLPGFSG